MAVTNFNEKTIEDNLKTSIIALGSQFTDDNVKIHLGATNPIAYRLQGVVNNTLVLISYVGDFPINSFQPENKTLKAEQVQFNVVLFERNKIENYQDIFTNKNLIKDLLYNINAVQGNAATSTQRVKLTMQSETRLPYSAEYPEIDGFVWNLKSTFLYKQV